MGKVPRGVGVMSEGLCLASPILSVMRWSFLLKALALRLICTSLLCAAGPVAISAVT